MNTKTPIILIENNEDDRLLFATIFADYGLKNRLKCFNTFLEAEQYVSANGIKPFLLFSNVLQFNEDSKEYNFANHKEICATLGCPCLFYSILFDQCFIIDTYSVPTYSYFINPYNEDTFKKVIHSVIQYWSREDLTDYITNQQ